MGQQEKDILIDKMAKALPLFRKALRLSQKGLANIIGVSSCTLIAFETQKRRMRWETFLALVLVFEKNENTKTLMRVAEVYTEDLDAFLTV